MIPKKIYHDFFDLYGYSNTPSARRESTSRRRPVGGTIPSRTGRLDSLFSSQPAFCVRYELSCWWTTIHHPALLLFSYLSTLISCLYVETSGKISFVVYRLFFFLFFSCFSFLLVSFLALALGSRFVSAKNAISCLIVDSYSTPLIPLGEENGKG